jgi:hypothetical protein
MGSRGRKSVAELSIVPAETAFRPRPPADLPAPLAEEWKAIVARMPNGWFGRESFGLLTAYLRHWWNAKLIAEQIDSFKPEWFKSDEGLDRFDQLSKVLEREQRAMSSLAGKMRLSQSSRTKPGSATTAVARSPGVRVPWELGEPIP